MTTPIILDNLRRFTSSMILGLVGFIVGGITLGVLTLYAYAIGWMLGAPAGFVWGGIVGWRKPLRDSIIILLCYLTLGIVVSIGVNASSEHSFDSFNRQIILVFLGGPVACWLATIPTRILSFTNRLLLAKVLLSIWTAAATIASYCWIYVWEPS